MTIAPNGYNIVDMNTIGEFIKQKRKEAGLTQEEFAIRSGLGLRFVRELEQGNGTAGQSESGAFHVWHEGGSRKEG